MFKQIIFAVNLYIPPRTSFPSTHCCDFTLSVNTKNVTTNTGLEHDK